MHFGLNLKLLSWQYLLTKLINKNLLQKFEIRIGCSYEVNEIFVWINCSNDLKHFANFYLKVYMVFVSTYLGAEKSPKNHFLGNI